MLEIDSHMARFSIKTIHGGDLTYVLDAAQERHNRDYADLLWDMMAAAIKQQCSSRCEVQEQIKYGHLSYVAVAPTYNELGRVLNVCTGAVEAWRKKYRIDTMRV